MTDGAMLTEILAALEILCDKCSFHGKLDALAAGLGISTEGRLLGDVLDDIAAKEGIQRDNRLYGAFIRKLYDYVTNGEDVTLEGNPLVLANSMGRPLKECVVSWEPTQEGEGTPYPAGGGPNLLDISQCTATVGKPYGVTVTIDGDIFKVSGMPSSEVTEEGQYSFAVASCAQAELRGKGYKVTPFAVKGNVSSAWGLRTEDESSLAISAKLTPGVNTDIQLRLMVSKNTPTAYAPYANVRPIHGRDSVQVERCGENLLNITPFTAFTKKGITYEYVANGGVHISGTATATVDSPTFAIGHLPPSKYYGLDMGTGIAASIVVQRNGSNLWLNAKGQFEILAGDVIKYWYLIANNGVTVDKTVYPYIVPGTTAPTTYSPYTGSTTTLTLPSIIYGGEVRADGAGQEMRKLLTLDGAEDWKTWGVDKVEAGQTGFYCQVVPDAAKTDNANIASHFVWKPGYLVHSGGNIGIGIAPEDKPYLMLCVKDTLLDDISSDAAAVASLKGWLAAQYAAGTPVQIAYKLDTPVPFTATGGGAIPTVKGTNTLLTDADTIKATYRCNVRAAEQELDALHTDLLQELEE